MPKHTRMFYYIRLHFAICKPACWLGYFDPQSFAQQMWAGGSKVKVQRRDEAVGPNRLNPASDSMHLVGAAAVCPEKVQTKCDLERTWTIILADGIVRWPSGYQSAPSMCIRSHSERLHVLLSVDEEEPPVTLWYRNTSQESTCIMCGGNETHQLARGQQRGTPGQRVQLLARGPSGIDR